VSIAPVEETSTATREEADVRAEPDTPWITLVWNDPVNLMSYVTWVFSEYFAYPRAKAEKLMMDVHLKGKAVVSHGSREAMERDAEALQGYGLWATFEKDD
jgi:ATP-dependent Clp protease adaptor protein ClpS